MEFETTKLSYVVPEKGHHYTPDFLLPNGVYIETKGLFTSEDRHKHEYVKAQHPGVDIRFVFSNANAKIAKKSPTSYAKWCDDRGFKWAHKVIPVEWLEECKG